jgi:hypothetical protein
MVRFVAFQGPGRRGPRAPGLLAKEAAFAFAFGWTFQKDGEIKSRGVVGW